ncbi:hypothetical protein C8R47DRAFT_1208338 [Mycena vitilis]|nr:hypothetical protein C8R47DRAFT_1208338 [Mycena vitilis]
MPKAAGKCGSVWASEFGGETLETNNNKQAATTAGRAHPHNKDPQNQQVNGLASPCSAAVAPLPLPPATVPAAQLLARLFPDADDEARQASLDDTPIATHSHLLSTVELHIPPLFGLPARPTFRRSVAFSAATRSGSRRTPVASVLDGDLALLPAQWSELLSGPLGFTGSRAALHRWRPRRLSRPFKRRFIGFRSPPGSAAFAA